MPPIWLLVIYCALIIVASLLGGFLPIYMKMTHTRLALAASFVGGAMLGVALMHLLPDAIDARLRLVEDEGGAVHDSLLPVMLWVIAGFLLMFFLERFFCYHHHGDVEMAADEQHNNEGRSGHRHGPDMEWFGALIGLTVHSMVAGLALAASVSAGLLPDGNVQGLAGFGTFLVIVLHKPFDSFTLGTIMAVGKAHRARRHLVNLLFSFAVPLGAFFFWLGLLGDEDSRLMAVTVGLSISAGAFLCISLSDLLPELQFHSHDRYKLSVALFIGLAIAWGITRLEVLGHAHGGHDHHDGHEHAQTQFEPQLGHQVPKAGDQRLDHDHMVGMLTPASLVWPLASVASK